MFQPVVFHIAVLLAQTPAPPAPLTLQAVVEEAKARNPELRALAAQLDADRHEVQHERVLMPPMLQAEIWQWPLSSPNPARATYQFMVEQELPGRGKRAAREKAALADVDVRAAAIPIRARDIVNDVQRTYADLFVARRALELSDETLSLLRQLADVTQTRYAAGRTEQQDVLKAVLEIARLREEQVMARERARMAEARLNVLLARDPATPIGPLTEPREDLAVPSLEMLQRLAIERQPDLAMARAEISRAEAAIELADVERKPDYLLRGGYMLMPGDAGAFTASVGITWPKAPWSKDRVTLAGEQARLGVNAARARHEAVVNSVKLDVAEAHIRVQSAADRASLLRTSLVPQAAQALDVARVGYQSGRGDFLDIVDTQRTRAEVRLGYYRALADLERARADLERAVGVSIFGGEAIAAARE
jgi:outer membrane protein TolC